MRFLVDGQPVECARKENLLVAMLKAGQHPTGGGCLCMAGDCGNCLATVDGVSYVRTCQTTARPGLVVERHPASGEPPLPADHLQRKETPIRYLFCDVAVIFFGPDEAGQAEVESARGAGKEVLVLNSAEGREAVAIYAGPLVVARTESEVLHVKVCDEIVVATGAAEIQPVVPGSELAGLVTARAADALAKQGVDLGRVVAVGTPPSEVECTRVEGRLLRFEGQGKVEAVVTSDGDKETRHPCDTVAVGLGLHPRDQLYLMAQDLSVPVRLVGEATLEATVPRCPQQGVICPCSAVSRQDLDFTWDSGFREMELIKRSTLAGTGACQGMTCIPYLRSFIEEKGGELQPRFTARPMTRQLTLGEIAAGGHHAPDLRTALHDEHLRLGAWMERSGPWWRPWNYGDPVAEYWAVREGVSIMDVSTLGKMLVSGPDTLRFLEEIYPTRVGTIKEGRSRYVLLLDERGYVFDDGLVAKESDTRYALTFTSGGSSHSEMWLRDWAHGLNFDVRILNQTYSLGAINVTGPQSRVLLERLGLSEPLKFMHFTDGVIAGVPCRVFRLSFTGELSFELHHPSEYSLKLWRALLEAGADLGIRPHGLDVLTLLRLEKGHIIVHQDTDFDSTPRRIRHEWMVKLEKEHFIGRQALLRTNALEPDKALVGFEMEGEPPIEGATISFDGNYAGFVTSSGYSHVLGKAVLMGHLYYFDSALPREVQIEGRVARRVDTPFYDQEASRARA